MVGTTRTATRRAAGMYKVSGLGVLFLIAATLPGWCQARGGGTSFRAVSRPPIVHMAGRVGTPLNPNFAPIHGTPGLGFDYQHLVAVGQSGRGRRGSENRGGRSFITPIFGSGLPYYYAFDTGFPYDYNAPAGQPSAEPLTPAPPEASEPPYSIAEVPTAPSIPPPELGQLILARRDGQVVMAVAFTTSGGRLTYITKDGVRRSFPITELDAETTRQMNDVNGTTVSIPN